MRRNNRSVLPIQAKTRIDAKFRAAFDYHCRLEMPGDPIALPAAPTVFPSSSPLLGARHSSGAS